MFLIFIVCYIYNNLAQLYLLQVYLSTVPLLCCIYDRRFDLIYNYVELTRKLQSEMYTQLLLLHQ